MTPSPEPNFAAQIPEKGNLLVAESLTTTTPFQGLGTNGNGHRQPLRRGEACLMCRAKKLKCSATKPVCDQCNKRKNCCVYDAVRPATRVEKLERTLAEMKEADLRAIMSSHCPSCNNGFNESIEPSMRFTGCGEDLSLTPLHNSSQHHNHSGCISSFNGCATPVTPFSTWSSISSGIGLQSNVDVRDPVSSFIGVNSWSWPDARHICARSASLMYDSSSPTPCSTPWPLLNAVSTAWSTDMDTSDSVQMPAMTGKQSPVAPYQVFGPGSKLDTSMGSPSLQNGQKPL